MKLLICSTIVLWIIVQDVNAGGMKKFLKGSGLALLAAGLNQQMMPLPIPLPIPIRMERQHHHPYPVCKSQPIHIHKNTEYVPYPVEIEKKKIVYIQQREKESGKKGSEYGGEEYE